MKYTQAELGPAVVVCAVAWVQHVKTHMHTTAAGSSCLFSLTNKLMKNILTLAALTWLCPPTYSIHELQDQFGVDPSITADKLPHIAASIGIMSVPGLIAWGADGAMRLAYSSGLMGATGSKPGSSSSGGAAGGLALAAAQGGGSAAAAAQASLLVPFMSLSYGYLPLVSMSEGAPPWAAGGAPFMCVCVAMCVLMRCTGSPCTV